MKLKDPFISTAVVSEGHRNLFLLNAALRRRRQHKRQLLPTFRWRASHAARLQNGGHARVLAVEHTFHVSTHHTARRTYPLTFPSTYKMQIRQVLSSPRGNLSPDRYRPVKLRRHRKNKATPVFSPTRKPFTLAEL